MKMIHKQMLAEMKNKEIFEKAVHEGNKYLSEIFDRNVFPTEEALNELKKFEEPMPKDGIDANAIIEFLATYGAPATVAQVAGRYYGFVNGGVVPVGLAVKIMTSFWDQNTPLYLTSPIASKLETIVEKWLIDLFNLPKNSVAGFVSGTSMATLCGLAAARWRIYRRLNYDLEGEGLQNAPKIRIVVGLQAHGTVVKALNLLGFGSKQIEKVEVTPQGQIQVDKIPKLDERTILILQAGNVNSGAFDDFSRICEKARKANAWVHIDGAFGLWTACSSRLDSLTNGIELANSWSLDGHKTLNTPYDNGIILCNDEEALISALHTSGAYINRSAHRDGMNFTPEMSRRGRIMELWAIFKYLGRKGIDELIYGFHKCALQFSEKIAEIEGYEVLNQVVFNQVLVRCKTNEITKKTLKKIQDLRECWVGGTEWMGKDAIRVSFCSWATTAEDIRKAINSFKIALSSSQL